MRQGKRDRNKAFRFKKYILLLIAILTAATVIAGDAFAADWYDTDWMYRRGFTIKSSMVPSDQTNFPVLMEITDPDLRDVLNGGKVNQADGGDILFTGADGTTQLDHEIEKYDPSTGELWVWIKVPVLSSTIDTILYIYYGNPDPVLPDQWDIPGTWDEGGANNYLMVQHLQEDAGGHFDSTSNNNDGVPSGVTQGVAGKINGADEFDGTDDRINFGDVLDFDVDDEFSICLWFNEISTGRSLLTKGQGGNPGYNGYVLDTGGSSGKVRFILREDGDYRYYITQQSTPSPSTGVWRHVCATYDGSNNINGLNLYVQGVNDFVVSGQNGPAGTFLSGYSLYIGTREGGGSYFNGTIDEVRFSDIVRTPDWIQTSFNNQNNLSSFYTEGAEENSLPDITVTDSVAPVDDLIVAYLKV